MTAELVWPAWLASDLESLKARTPALCCECGNVRDVDLTYVRKRGLGDAIAPDSAAERSIVYLRCQVCRATTTHAYLEVEHPDLAEQLQPPPQWTYATALEVVAGVPRLDLRELRELDGCVEKCCRSLAVVTWFLDTDRILLEVDSDSTSAWTASGLASLLQLVTDPGGQTWPMAQPADTLDGPRVMAVFYPTPDKGTAQ